MDNPDLWVKLNLVVEELIAAELPRNNARVKTAFLKQVGTRFDTILGSHGFFLHRKLLNKKQLVDFIGLLPNNLKSDDLFDLMAEMEMGLLKYEPNISSLPCSGSSGSILSTDVVKLRNFDEEKEAVHLFSGLPYALLEYDEECHMLWEECIVHNMMVEISDASKEDLSIILILRNFRCTETFLKIAGVFDEHYTEHCTLQEMFENIVQIAISYATKEVNKDERGFPSSCSTAPTNQWVSLDVGDLQLNLGKSCDDDSTPTSISICLYDPCDAALDFEKYLFHGTDWESAINIVANGIDLTAGKRGTDFGSQCFYLGLSFDMAVKMAVRKGGTEQAAVVVYHVDWLDGIASHDFDEPNSDWKSTVFKFRRFSDKGHIAFTEKYRDIGIMRGPHCRNPRGIQKANNFDTVEHIVNNDGTVPKQIAIRSETVASIANGEVKGILFCSALLNGFEGTQTDDAKH